MWDASGIFQTTILLNPVPSCPILLNLSQSCPILPRNPALSCLILPNIGLASTYKKLLLYLAYDGSSGT